ncbi:hypothetical protein BKP43_28560 [Variovorax boronicumulans]|uniref:hypothetical protein n=1 Tax=Variovorax boronicumulans TaxID=436515 RepID=UPI00209C25F0|nr:hypothetical protein [Variovorax boronicumulans]PBI89726.1 hypothetical protein BKP43_28560 [Variovorax boronicumulans]
MSLSDLLGSAWQGLHSASNPDETPAAEGLEDCLVFFAWSDGTTQARVLSGRGKDLETAWAQGAQALEAQATGVPRDLRVDWVRRVRPLRWTAFKDGLGIPAAEGLAFDARCESALLAPQVDSQRRRLLNAPTDDDTTVWAFQTRAVHVDASGVHILAADGLRELQPFDVPLLRRLVAGGADHLAARVQTDGALAPSTPDADAPRAADHAHAVHALLEAWDPAQAETRQAAIHRALARLTRTLIRPAALPNGTHVACLVEPGSNDTSLGANAACIGALVRYTELSRDRRYLPLLDQLARTVLHMQDPISGRFAHTLHHPSMAEKAEAPGDAREDDQAVVALLRLYALTGNRRWFGAVEKAFEHFVAASYANAQDHALCRATSSSACRTSTRRSTSRSHRPPPWRPCQPSWRPVPNWSRGSTPTPPSSRCSTGSIAPRCTTRCCTACSASPTATRGPSARCSSRSRRPSKAASSATRRRRLPTPWPA